MGIELLARHAGLDRTIEILGPNIQSLVHPGKVDRQPAVDDGGLALERRTCAIGNDRQAVRRAHLDQRAHFLGRRWIRYGVGRHGREMRLARAMVR